jgi:2-methylcitrate dehydratase PrpD
MGCAIAGASAPSSEIVLDVVRENGGAPKAAVVATTLRTSLPDAALANGMLASALLYDDTSLDMHGHSTATLMPVVLALGEALNLSGRAMLEAYIIGFEIEAAIGKVLDPEHYERGWHATTTIGSLGAAAAACRLMSMPAHQVRMALGLAATMTGGSRQNFGTMTQALHGGIPARNGMVAAQLASRGFTADPDILEARMGFFALFGPDTRKIEFDPSRLGNDWAFLRPVLALKLYPCGFPTFRPIEGTIELGAEHNVDPEAVEEIRCGVHYLLPQTVFHENPQTGLQGKTSLPYCVARALIDGRMGLAQFTDEKVQDPQARRLMAKVRVEVPPELSREAMQHVNSIAAPAFIEIRLKDGTVLKKRQDHYRGAPEQPLSAEDVAGKFRDCADGVLGPAMAARALDVMQNLETLEDGAGLARLVTLRQ